MGCLNQFGYPDPRSEAEYEADHRGYADLVRRRQEHVRKERAASIATSFRPGPSRAAKLSARRASSA